MRAVACAIALAVAGCGGCGKKAEPSGPAADVTGLAAVPATAEAVIGADVAKLAESPIVARMIQQILARDSKLLAAWQHVHDGCKIDVAKQVKHVIVALGPTPPGGRAGSGPALLVANGHIPETDLTDCIGKFVGKGGGSVTGRPVEGKTVYEVKDGNRTMYFAYGRADTVVLGTTEAYVIEAIRPGKKLPDNPEMSAWFKLVDQNMPVWAVGRLDDRVRQGLLRLLPGLKAGMTAVVGTADPTEGAKLELDAVMASDGDAKQLESFAIDQKTMLAMAAQIKGLGPVVNKVTIEAKGNVVHFRAPLTMQDVNDVLSVLDAGKAPAQDSPPPKSGP